MPFIIPPVQTITEVFCQDGASGADYSIPPVTSSSTTIVTQANGYPISQATPLNSGGVAVDRSQTNGIFYLYSSALRWLNVGGYLTFDPAVASAGGYPQYCILFNLANKRYVINLIPYSNKKRILEVMLCKNRKRKKLNELKLSILG